MNKAFVDTTILANSLLKDDITANVAKDALARFDITELPVYAIKEFKAGPLHKFKWFHNKLALTGSFDHSIAALHRMSLTPRRYTTATAIEALRTATDRLKHTNLLSLVKKYGVRANSDNVLCDQYRLTLKAKILKAWKFRRRLTTSIVVPLSCYEETGPYELQDGQIEIENLHCVVNKECCLAPVLRARLEELKKLRDAIIKEPKTAENDRRLRTLKDLIRKPKALVTEKACCNLGDAFFALFAPSDSVILTTNLKDHSALANALAKRAESP
jgi:hypothetical protein